MLESTNHSNTLEAEHDVGEIQMGALERRANPLGPSVIGAVGQRRLTALLSEPGRERET